MIVACAHVGACPVHECLPEGAEAEDARFHELEVRCEAEERRDY
jgi:hypothetical protein